MSSGERQRVKLAKYLNQKGNIYVLDEPTTGLHASDVKNIMALLDGFVKRSNTVIVIKHNLDVMKQADYLIDVGPDDGTSGGAIVFAGTPRQMLDSGRTITADLFPAVYVLTDLGDGAASPPDADFTDSGMNSSDHFFFPFKGERKLHKSLHNSW